MSFGRIFRILLQHTVQPCLHLPPVCTPAAELLTLDLYLPSPAVVLHSPHSAPVVLQASVQIYRPCPSHISRMSPYSLSASRSPYPLQYPLKRLGHLSSLALHGRVHIGVHRNLHTGMSQYRAQSLYIRLALDHQGGERVANPEYLIQVFPCHDHLIIVPCRVSLPDGLRDSGLYVYFHA